MDKIYYNGKILTMQGLTVEEECNLKAEAVLIRDGKILAVGTEDHVRGLASEDAAECDLDGRCLMPGFIDPHSHFIMSGQMSLWADLSDCESYDDIVAALREYKDSNPNLPFVIGFGYDHNFLKEGRHPDRFVLDQVSTEIPVFVLHISIHFGCGNSVLIKYAGITADTPDPEGGVIGRLENNEPSGYFEETAMHYLLAKFSLRGSEKSPEIYRKMQENYLRFGVTTVQDGATTPSEMKELAHMAQADILHLDVVAYPLMTDHGEETMQAYMEYTEGYHNHVKIGGYKLVLDGSPQGRSAWMSEPYLGDDPDYCAYPWLNDQQVENYIRTAIREKRQVLAHCNGDAASEQFVNAYDKVMSEEELTDDLRPVMIHCQTVRNDQLDRMSKLHMIASIFVGHVWYWGDVHVRNFGPQRGNHISPVKDALDRNVKVNFHQDTPVTRPDMMHSVWCAVNRISRGGNIIGEDQKIDVYQALRAITIDAAYEYFEEGAKGSIEPGKRADLVILEESPLEVDPLDIRKIHVLETIKDGETVYQALE